MKSQFLSNYTKETFLEKIKTSLRKCSSFYFSVSFIKKAGLVLLLKDIKEALERGAVGRIITSSYQNFTDISTLNEFYFLMERYKNFDCHLDFNCFGDSGFHTKGYLFEYGDSYELVVGSSNLTRYALLKNVEWNIIVALKDKGKPYSEILNEFEYLWKMTYKLSQELINRYAIQLDFAIEKWDMDYVQNYDIKIKPNLMQKRALKEIRRYRDMGVNKALVIAATGSGKTYLSAFDAKNFGAKRLLFIVHRDTIIKEALKTFFKVFQSRVSYGIFMGKTKEINCDFIFSTNMTMSKNLDLFSKDEFDYIVVDEVHHGVADTYRKIIDYFEPEFMLGLTATPERMDNQSVFELFDKNVPYELRLRDALENDLIVPFKYFGIKDDFIDYSKDDLKNLIKQFANEIHCEFIKEKIEYYRPKGKLKAIGFCRSIEHSRIMAEKMEGLGYSTTYLTGRDDTGTRMKAFHDLQADDKELEIIFTVDLLNEGVDIPAINLIMFLRPTESSTIFIQQLGRGLRKFQNKNYLTVLDFIANSYQRSVQIALALGSLSKNISIDKRLLCNFVREDFAQLDLPVEIYFDEISKNEIIQAIENTQFNSILFFKQDYFNFKKYLGLEDTPKHIDYLNIDNGNLLNRCIKKYGSYYNFLNVIGEDIPLFTKEETEFLKYLSSFIPIIRPYEYLIIKELISGEKNIIELREAIDDIENYNSRQFEHALLNLQNKFYSEKEQATKEQYLLEDNGYYSLSISLDNDKFVEEVYDLIEYGLTRYEIEFNYSNEELKLYANYSRKQFLEAICYHAMAFREGVLRYDDELYLFVDLKKDLSKEEWLLYEDKFISNNKLQWESQTNTTFTNAKGIGLLNQKSVHLFVRKIRKEDGIIMPYIYLGRGQLTNPRESNNIKKSLLFDIVLDNQIPEYLKYDFEIPEEYV